MTTAYNLSDEQMQILTWKVEGLSGKEIAEKLHISNALFSKKMTVICRKLGAKTKIVAVRRAAKEFFPGRTRVKGTPLTEKEKEVFRLLFDDLSTQEVAEKLDISIATVNDRVYHACKKFNANTREHFAAVIVDSVIE